LVVFEFLGFPLLFTGIIENVEHVHRIIDLLLDIGRWRGAGMPCALVMMAS
jgi:hypothetical protein